MTVTLVFIILANACTLYAVVPYIRETARGNTKPRVASWFGWAALTAVGAVAAFQQHQLPAAIFLTFCTVQNFSVVVLGLKHGNRNLSSLDLIAIGGALAGGLVLFFLNSPVLGTWVAIIADCIVLLPTLKHTWQQPGEETASTYFFEGLGAIFTLAVAGGFAFTAIAYPLYLLIADEILVILIHQAHRRQQVAALNSKSSSGSVPPPGVHADPESYVSPTTIRPS